MDGAGSARLSIALCTCNGDRFLGAQLDSIRRQSRLPDELVACDDYSTDDTMAQLEAFAGAAPFAVRVHRNSVRLGTTRNFEQAIALCQGDIIALADQDDVWQPDKLATLAQLFAANPALGLAFSDALLVNEALTPTGQRLWQTLPFPPVQQRRFDQGEGPQLLMRYNVVTGSACALRASLRPQVLPIPAPWEHDAWIGILVASLAETRTVAAPLLLYRQHGGQQVGARQRTLTHEVRAALRRNVTDFERRLTCFQNLAERLEGLQGQLREPALLEAVRGKIVHSQAQLRLRRASRLARPLLALRELLTGHYHRYGRGLKSFAADALL
jgi:glycosyltransferase involved in cell wall biosynthesis